MLPQMLGLDVLVERVTRKLVTVEVNGERSGYLGLISLGEDLSERIMTIIGESLRGQKILVNPANFNEFILTQNTAPLMQQLRHKYGVSLDFAPYLTDRLKTGQFEDATGISLRDYDSLLGFGRLVIDSDLDERMINTPSVELVTCDKLLQYLLLKDVPDLNMPETRYFDVAHGAAQMIGFQKRRGKVVQKPRHGSLGNGIVILEKGQFRVYHVFNWGTELTRLEVFKEFGYKGDDDKAAMDAFANDLYQRDQEQATAMLAELIQTNDASFTGFISFYYKNYPNLAHAAAKIRLAANGVIMQPFIETETVTFAKTGEQHFAKARLIWFGDGARLGGYLGGYWALSSNPVSEATREDPIVNYSRTGIAQAFTPEEAQRFKQYAEHVAPRILTILAPVRGKLREYDELETKVIKETMLAQATAV